MRRSIQKHISATFIVLMAVAIFLCWFINGTLLQRFYIENKQKALRSAYKKIQESIDSGNLTSEQFGIELDKICEKYNINVIIMDADTETIKSSGKESNILGARLMENLFGRNPNAEIIEENQEPYYVLQNVMDIRTNTEYIEMWGVFDNGNIFLMRSAIESIKESVAISNRFLMYIGAITIVVSAIVVHLISGRISKPILQLSDISQRMAKLDFNARYEGKEENEIGLLGENINTLSKTLEKTISELKTANNELQRDNERKTRIDEMRKEFLSHVSHELKTPIALIQGYAEGLAEGVNDDAESRQFYCEVIMDEANKMNTMVQKLLTLNQLEFGNDQITMERFSITALINNYIQNAQILIQQKGVTVHMEQKEDIFVWADEFKTEEVFMNYFTNALNYALGEKEVIIRFYKRDNILKVGVFNTGNPIDEECIPHLWEQFYKVDKARSREYGGSGVGLSIVKAIMESMNREYGVTNYSNGVEFWFELEMV